MKAETKFPILITLTTLVPFVVALMLSTIALDLRDNILFFLLYSTLAIVVPIFIVVIFSKILFFEIKKEVLKFMSRMAGEAMKQEIMKKMMEGCECEECEENLKYEQGDL